MYNVHNESLVDTLEVCFQVAQYKATHRCDAALPGINNVYSDYSVIKSGVTKSIISEIFAFNQMTWAISVVSL
jgi:hypothetical protein